MTDTDAGALLERLFEAHGGLERWLAVDSVEAVVSARGALFTTKGLTPLHGVRVRVWPGARRVQLVDYPERGRLGDWRGDEEVRILRGPAIEKHRLNPRAAFFGPFRHWRWDDLDVVYFVGYALWNYLSGPFLLREPGCRVAQVDSAGKETRLHLRFDDTVPTHCARQTWYVDADQRIGRLDYTAEVVGSWARVAQVCGDYRQVDGLWFATRRRVWPRIGNLAVAPVALVALDIGEIRPLWRDDADTDSGNQR